VGTRMLASFGSCFGHRGSAALAAKTGLDGDEIPLCSRPVERRSARPDKEPDVPQSFSSIAKLFLHRVETSGSQLAFRFPSAGGWGELTWNQTGERVKNIANGLVSLGLGLEERTAILASTSVEWLLADFGVLCGGGATTTVYPSNTPDECQYILEDSDSKFIFAEDDDQVAKILEVRDRLPNLKTVITFTGKAQEDGYVITLADLEALGKKYAEDNGGAYEERIESVNKNMLATLIYTSGTTGVPKGVELTHDCWLFEGEAIENIGIVTQQDHQYLWLPLSHSFGKVLQIMQLQIGFPTTVDGNIPKLIDNLAVVRPTFMGAPPRIFEKVYNKIVTGAQASPVKWKIFQWSLAVGRKVSSLRQQRREPSGLLLIKYKIADKLVFSKLKARFGGRIKYFISGSAPLSREMAEFFHAADLLILEGYGLTESSAGSCINRPDTFAFGTVGPPFPGVEVKIAEEDGEILMRGRGIMRGYRNKEEATKETLTEDGWLRTGDIGEVDSQGRIKITDRKKDLIKTSGGKYVAPQHLEGKLKSLWPFLSQVLVHGNNRHFCTAVITLDPEGIPAWLEDNGLSGTKYEDLGKNDKVIAAVQEAVDKLNSGLASYETIKKFAILPADFTVETGELTASMKVKRKAVEKQYEDLLAGFYEGALAA
jgi:long-chain acyl-CoA synthetase